MCSVVESGAGPRGTPSWTCKLLSLSATDGSVKGQWCCLTSCCCCSEASSSEIVPLLDWPEQLQYTMQVICHWLHEDCVYNLYINNRYQAAPLAFLVVLLCMTKFGSSSALPAGGAWAAFPHCSCRTRIYLITDTVLQWNGGRQIYIVAELLPPAASILRERSSEILASCVLL